MARWWGPGLDNSAVSVTRLPPPPQEDVDTTSRCDLVTRQQQTAQPRRDVAPLPLPPRHALATATRSHTASRSRVAMSSRRAMSSRTTTRSPATTMSRARPAVTRRRCEEPHGHKEPRNHEEPCVQSRSHQVHNFEPVRLASNSGPFTSGQPPPRHLRPDSIRLST